MEADVERKDVRNPLDSTVENRLWLRPRLQWHGTGGRQTLKAQSDFKSMHY